MGLVNPAALILSVFVVGLVLLYLWERNQRRVDVPSLLLWETIPESVVRRSRFQPDLLFWLQLAALCALLLGLANPYFEGFGHHSRPSRAILVLDLSASMQTVEDGTSRLELAREAAARVLQSYSPETELMLIGAALEPSIIAPFTRDRTELLEIVSKIEAKDVTTNLEPALAMAQRLAFHAPIPPEMHIFTDVPRTSVQKRWSENVNWWPFGSSADNLAISNVETTQGILQAHRRGDARVTVRNFSDREQHGSLKVTVAGEVIGQELFTTKPHGVEIFHFPQLAGSGMLEATLQTDDALDVDNHWRTWLPHFAPLRVVLIGEPSELSVALARLDAAAPAFQVEVRHTYDSTQDLADADIAIFHRTTPQRLPETPTLLIAPDFDLGSRELLPELEGLEVIDWSDQHDILGGIQPQLLGPFELTKLVAPPPWGETVLAGQSKLGEVPFLVVGEPDDHRVAILTPDLANERLMASDRETTLLLFLNVLDWLAGRRESVPVARTGESRPLDEEVVGFIDPRGQRIDVQSQADSPAVLNIDRAGSYNLSRKDGSRSTILANFHDAAESDVARVPTSTYRVDAEISPTTDRGAEDGLQNWFYLSAAVLLLAEWITAARVRDHG